MRRGWLPLVAVCAGTAVVAILLASMVSESVLTKVSVIVGLVVGAATLYVAIADRINRARHSTAANGVQQLREAARFLASCCRSTWESEATLRGLWRSKPIPVGWALTAPPPVDETSENPVGDVNDLPRLVNANAHRQLIVLGATGSGKTTALILLTIELLKRRTAKQPVPVLLRATSWQPKQPFKDWIAAQLKIDYAMHDRTEYGPGIAHRLIDNALILPVIDGFDELPAEQQNTAAKALADWANPGKPMVLACRTDAFHESLQRKGYTFPHITMVTMQALSVRQIADAIVARYADTSRWKPVLAAVQGHSDSPLAQVLSSPLMLDLANTIYASDDTRPADLLELPDAHAIQHHLLDAYLPAVYDSPPTSSTDRPIRNTKYCATQAEAWLSFLALHLRLHNTHDIAWWHLHDYLYRFRQTANFLIAATLVSLCVFGVWMTPGTESPIVSSSTRQSSLFATALALLLGWNMLTALAAGMINKALRPDRATTTPRQLGRRPVNQKTVLRWSAAVLACGLIWTPLQKAPLQAALADGLFLGAVVVAALVTRGFNNPDPTAEPRGPAATMKDDRNSLTFIALIAFTSILISVAPAFATSRAVTLVAVAVVTWVVFLLAVMAVFKIGQSWFTFRLAHLWLAIHGHAPWRFMAFLDDAHRRGVLRQTGPVYQFRHQHLRDCLRGTDVSGF